MNNPVINIQTVKEAKVLASIHRKMNGTDVHYLDLVDKIEERQSKNPQKPQRIHHDTSAERR